MTAQRVAAKIVSSVNPVQGMWKARDLRNSHTPLSKRHTFWSHVATLVREALDA